LVIMDFGSRWLEKWQLKQGDREMSRKLECHLFHIVGEKSRLRAVTHSGLAVLGMRPDRIAKGDEKLRLAQSNAFCGKFAHSESSSRSLLGSIPMYRLGQVEIEGWVS